MQRRRKLQMTRGKRSRGRKQGRVSIAKDGRFRLDVNGNSYGGIIRSLRLNNAQSFPGKPARPLDGADYSTCQAFGTFAISNGITAGTGNTPPQLVADVGANLFWTLAFSLQDLTQVATLTALFDQYRVDKVIVKLVPQSTSINVMNTASPNNLVPTLYAVLDFDDSTALGSIAAAVEYDNCQIVPYGQGVEIEVTPSYTPAIYAAGAFSGYAVQKAGWVDCANTSVAHYGIKGVVSALTALSTSTVAWNIYPKYYVSFRNTR